MSLPFFFLFFFLLVEAVADRFDVNISQYFDDCFGFIDEAKETGGGVLIHCFAGRSRRSFVAPHPSIVTFLILTCS